MANTKPGWMAGLDMTASTALSKRLSMSQAELEARQASEAAQVAADHARKEASRKFQADNFERAALTALIREAFAAELAS